MMKFDLTLRVLLERANQLFPKKEIITRDYSGTFRYTYADFYKRVNRLANTLKELGVKPGDRVGTLAWNHHRHLELYFGVPCSGAVLHTLNLRLSPDQLAYVINHGEDKVIFVDKDLVPLAEAVKEKLTTVKHFVVMSDTEELPASHLSPAASYEALLSKASDQYDFPDIDEWSTAAMCYTTATTGNPKGVEYTHRGLVLHSYTAALPDALNISESDRIMPFVPMFHANAWGLPFVCTFLGTTQVFPGPRPTPEDICAVIDEHKVTLAAGVPTIWMGTLNVWETGRYDHTSLRALICGGSAVPRALHKAYLDKLGLPIIHAYGMTETTPVVLVCNPKSYMQDMNEDDKLDLASKQGILVPGLEMKVVNEDGNEVPWDGRSMGELLVRGPWIAKEYYKEPERSKPAFADGWLHTGDIVNVDPEGYCFIVDRAKDLIKSGGEWISSIDLENTIMAHPAVLEAAVIAMPHDKWVERPLACVVLKEDHRGSTTADEIIHFLTDQVPKIWLPDRVEFIEEIPKTSVGKFDKKELRQIYADVAAVEA
ncbi:long-chain fatty acid--CoA ligase [Metallumcola ferriviriculae]|uniref:Long-chain fatty acid--CoA ligase n=1 Tax=Metallumcola ferriviriculae TaxID=3039180 RepID=A0AAU0UND0_9FIRM|nr:long-chain fatty acid--CoA ligase [Desulfitibacteraceae bacterium MK1]